MPVRAPAGLQFDARGRGISRRFPMGWQNLTFLSLPQKQGSYASIGIELLLRRLTNAILPYCVLSD